MKIIDLIVTVAWSLLTIFSFIKGDYYVGILELLLAIHTLSDALEAK